MSDFSLEKISKFIKIFENDIKRKKRGINDYNPLLAVQKMHNEEHMHSGFLHSMLDTNGLHYQDDLFLRQFLELAGLLEWFGETKNATIKKECKDIDIYITNKYKHIIIENKINADDKEGQIARYIKSVRDDNESVDYENLAVIYLTLNGKKPSDKSLKFENLTWEISQNSIKSSDGEVKYKQMSYKNDILKWCDECQKEVYNTTNLKLSFEFYKNVVEILTSNKADESLISQFKKDKVYCEIALNAGKIADKFGEYKDAITEFVDKNNTNIQKIQLDLQVREFKEQGAFGDWEVLSADEIGENYVCFGGFSTMIRNKAYAEQTFSYAFYVQDNVAIFVAGLFIKKDKNLKINSTILNEYAQALKKIIEQNKHYIANWGGGGNRSWVFHYKQTQQNVKDFFNQDGIYQTYRSKFGTKKLCEVIDEINEYLKNEENDENSAIYKLSGEVRNFNRF